MIGSRDGKLSDHCGGTSALGCHVTGLQHNIRYLINLGSVGESSQCALEREAFTVGNCKYRSVAVTVLLVVEAVIKHLLVFSSIQS